VPNNTQRTTQVSYIADPFGLGGNARKQMSIQEIIDIKAQLGMSFALYCYKESEPNDKEDDCHIDRVKEDMKDGETKVDGEDEIVELDEPINPFMELSTLFIFCCEWECIIRMQ
jgi:hypothetical protein